MSGLFAAARLFPYWGLAAACTAIEVGLYFRRRRKRGKMAACWAVSAIFLALIAMWLARRGDLHSDEWVRAWLER
jgi:hypothetical protein